MKPPPQLLDFAFVPSHFDYHYIIETQRGVVHGRHYGRLHKEAVSIAQWIGATGQVDGGLFVIDVGRNWPCSDKETYRGHDVGEGKSQ